MKASFLILATFLLAPALHAQSEEKADTAWTFTGSTALNFSQLSLTNWSAGGENNLAANALVNLAARYQKEKILWENTLIMGLGGIKQGDDPVRKSDDQIDLASKLGIKASENWNYTGLLGFNTQFAEGVDAPGEANALKISNFMAPAYLNLSLGMDYVPGKAFSLLLSPLSGKFTFVLDDELSADGAFGVGPDQRVRAEFGGYVKIAFKQEILKNVVLDTKLDLFSNYLENPQYVDVNWDLLLTFKVNDYLSASLLTQLIYDYDIKFGADSDEDRIQFKELFGLGLTYNF